MLVGPLLIIKNKEKSLVVHLLQILLTIIHSWSWKVPLRLQYLHYFLLLMHRIRQENCFIYWKRTLDIYGFLIRNQRNIQERTIEHIQERIILCFGSSLTSLRSQLRRRNILSKLIVWEHLIWPLELAWIRIIVSCLEHFTTSVLLA